MINTKRKLLYLLAEPAMWLFYCFFQPTKFQREYEPRRFVERFVSMLKLALPLFLISYLFSLMIRIIICIILPELIPSSLIAQTLPTLIINLVIFLLNIAWITLLGIGWGTIGGIGVNIRLGVVFSLGLGIGFGSTENAGLLLSRGIAVAVALGILGGIAEDVTWRKDGIAWHIGSMNWHIGATSRCLIGGLVGGIAWSFVGGFQEGLLVMVVFAISYLIGFYRLPLYIISGFSSWRTSILSKKKPHQVFVYLHKSSLYWDEFVFLPLLSLKDTLLFALRQTDIDHIIEKVYNEIQFIIKERPQQIHAALEAALEIAIHDLETCNNLHDFARVHHQLEKLFPQQSPLLTPWWKPSLNSLKNASREAAKYCHPHTRIAAQRDALLAMQQELDKVHPPSAFSNHALHNRLREVVRLWSEAAEEKITELEVKTLEIIWIDNPYTPGPALQPQDSLFVGRADIVKKLHESLHTGKHFPTFLLNGERRMGKSSTLHQLPNLLGGQCLPIIYDLQVREITSNITVFLYDIAHEIFEVMSSRGIEIGELDISLLQQKRHENEAAVYAPFNRWFDRIEKTLNQENRTLLLAFDEFDKLGEAAMSKYLDLILLLDWFRSITQHRSRLALLFSGARTLEEMSIETGLNWAEYFVNAQTLRVSFLQPNEAVQLITQPVPRFPSEKLFGKGVVEEIIRVTGCHPFLVQAVCSAIIDQLKSNNRNPANIDDVKIAMNVVLENWWDTFFNDLWERTNRQQRECLRVIRNLAKGDLQTIIQKSGLDEQSAKITLQKLLWRDLIVYENNEYRVSTPIFYEWLARKNF